MTPSREQLRERALRDEIEAEGIERVVYGKGLAEMRWINATLVAALSAGQEAEQTLSNITAEDVKAFVSSLYRMETPWAVGCASVLTSLWGDRVTLLSPSVNPPEQPEQGAVANSIDLWHKLLEWNRQQADPLIKVGYEYAVAEQAIKFYAAPPNQPGSALKLAREQANDAGLWFKAKYASEQYLQDALRAMHRAVEGAEAQNSGEAEAVAQQRDEAQRAMLKMIGINARHCRELKECQEAPAIAILWACTAEGGWNDDTKEYYDWALSIKETIDGNPQNKDIIRRSILSATHPSAGAEAVRQDAVMVPMEATKQMREAGEDAAVKQYDDSDWEDAKDMAEGLDVEPIYRAMLAAAPGQQSAEKEGE